MKGKVNLKIIIVIVILILVAVLIVLGMNTVRTYMSGAASGSDPQRVMSTPNEDGKSAEVTWTTEKAVMSTVEYGTNPASLLLRGLESEATNDHRITLSSLKPGVTYYFRIKVDEEAFDDNGIPFSFKTNAAAAVVTPPPVVTAIPTVALVPTSSSKEICNRTTDYNKDGIVNSLDYTECLKSGGAPQANPTVSTPSATGSASSDCKMGVDYDGNGVTNSLDRIKCLQNKR